MGEKATQAFNYPEIRYQKIATSFDVDPPAKDYWDVEELCAAAHFCEAVDGLKKLKLIDLRLGIE